MRYHFGDDPDGKLGWANPSFDDSAWPQAKNGHWPLPSTGSDGFMWTRRRVLVPKDAVGPLALRVIDEHQWLISGPSVVSFQIFINGRPVANGGSFPPNPEPVVFQPLSVFELPPGLVQPGASVDIAYRVWFHPRTFSPASFRGTRFEIGESRNLRLVNHADRLAALIAMGPDFAINAFIAILGIILLVFWRWAGGRVLLVCSGVLLVSSLGAIHGNNYSLRMLAIPWRLDVIAGDVLLLVGLILMLELTWAVHAYRNRVLKRAGLAAILGMFGFAVPFGLTTAASAPVFWTLGLGLSSMSWVIFLLGTNLWPLFTGRRSWLIGIALAIDPAVVMLAWLGVRTERTVGHFYLSFLSVGNLASYLVVFAVLSQNAWKAWRARDELRVEFETAREVQQRLVAPPGHIPGFKMDCVYQPAKQVGGDFFRVTPEGGGSVLIVVGDVSGKGLSAAMTVSAVIGALRSIPPVSPAWILNALNCGLVGQMHGGFVTCCVSRIAADGAMTHPAPYCNGEELAVEPGLPLGMLTDASYAETSYQIPPGDRLTFVSDGVFEATNPQGELYGFERTQAVSNLPANAIAEAATRFGQQDDITVLTVTVRPV